MKPLSRQQRIALVCGTTIACIFAVFLLPSIPQDPAYHNFADKRLLFGLPNFDDVISNALFVLVGLAGLTSVWQKRARRAQASMWMTFFLGVFLTGFGSSYYHLAPDNHTLVWDRLPMTISFMSLFAALIAERIDSKTGSFLFPLLIGAGIGSVCYWNWTESLGHGDLRFYALVQFLPVIVILMILALFPARHAGTKHLLYTFAWYVLAKLLEHFDPQVFSLTDGIISGHTLKHIAAAIGAGCMLGYVGALKENNDE